jgi:FtsP/CotA-like multicopper oxidase with cupredoxin domain
MSIQALIREMLRRRGPIIRCCVLAAFAAIAYAVSQHDAMSSASGAAASDDRKIAPTARIYYIAADEVEWDYAPSGTNLVEGRPFNDDEKPYMEAGPTVIGRRAIKALYREYTDGTFKTLKPRPPEWEHLGFLGPLIRAQVGDTIRVVFKNNVKFPATIHPHGVLYDKESEGAVYADGTTGTNRSDAAVPPGGTRTYLWRVPERAGPSEHEGSSAFWMYHSHADEVRDVASGLIGPIIITRSGMARADCTPVDVDREIIAGFITVDENSSWYLERNVQAFATEPSKVSIIMGRSFSRLALPSYDKYFKETINGFCYGNTPGMTMKVGQRVRWYLMASTNFELHTPHWHGNVVTLDHMRTDVAVVLTMGMSIADMIPDNPGKWLFHCHVTNHFRMGMQAFYVVEPAVTH